MEAIEVGLAGFEFHERLISAIMDLGYRRLPDNRDINVQYFLPCPVGAFLNSSSQDAKGCTPCPPGIIQKSVFLFFK